MRVSLIVLMSALLSACNNSSDSKKDIADTTLPAVQMPPPPATPDTIFSGYGNEPFWSVHVIRDSKIVFHPMDGPDVEVPYAVSNAPDSLAAAYSSSANGNSIELLVYKRDCSDGMSDITHRYEVKLRVNQNKFTGCGREN